MKINISSWTMLKEVNIYYDIARVSFNFTAEKILEFEEWKVNHFTKLRKKKRYNFRWLGPSYILAILISRNS